MAFPTLTKTPRCASRPSDHTTSAKNSVSNCEYTLTSDSILWMFLCYWSYGKCMIGESGGCAGGVLDDTAWKLSLTPFLSSKTH